MLLLRGWVERGGPALGRKGAAAIGHGIAVALHTGSTPTMRWLDLSDTGANQRCVSAIISVVDARTLPRLDFHT
eukprot:4168440-Prymnesium_polylepis.1